MPQFRYLLILAISAIALSAHAQSNTDSLTISKNRQQADSILNVLRHPAAGAVHHAATDEDEDNESTETPAATSAPAVAAPVATPPAGNVSTPPVVRQAADSVVKAVTPVVTTTNANVNAVVTPADKKQAEDSIKHLKSVMDRMKQAPDANDAHKAITTPDTTAMPNIPTGNTTPPVRKAHTDGAAPAAKYQGAPGGQQPAGQAGKAQGGMPAGMPNFAAMKLLIGHIYGKVIDDQKKPVSYVAVSIKTAKDSLIGGQLTEDNGEFSISDLPLGAYTINIKYLGYKEINQKVVLTQAKTDQDVGNIAMVPDATKLKEVDVTGTKSTMELKVDRKVFNVGSDISARGGTGLDVMKNIPSVSIDADGNVQLRNNTPQVYIDGKPTTLTLEQIPADQIDRVEVITNPSAKFEAASSGGIINVVMKRNTKPGYNGIVNMNIATNTGYNGLAMINLKQRKFGVSLMYTINGATNKTNGYNNSKTLDAFNNVGDYTNQNIVTTNKRIFQVARVAFDFYINNRNTLSISENAVFGNFNTNENIGITADSSGVVSNGTKINNQLNHFRNFTTDLTFKHTYPKEGKEYTLDIQYNHSQGGGNYLYTTTQYYPGGNIYALNPTYQTYIGAQTADMITAQWDISLPIGKNMKIETGARLNYKLTNSYNNVTNDSTVNNARTTPDFDYGLSNNYRIDDLVTAAYITFTHQVKNFSYQLGLRAEEVYYKGTSKLNGDSAFSYQYPTTVSSIPKILFPSFNLSQKWGTKHELQFNAARKSNRPNFFQIAPFVFSSTQNSIQRGNPALQPEFINQGELNYSLAESKVSWLTSAYGRYVQQPITTYIYVDPTNAARFINSFSNGDHSITGGWENTLKIFPVKKLDITLSGNVFYTTIEGGNTEGNASNSGFSWLAKAMVSYKLPLDFTIQANGTYEAPKILPQGKTTPLYYFDLSLSKDFMGFITLNLTVSDVLNSKANGTNYYQASVNDGTGYIPGFQQDLSRRRDTRYAKLGVSFRFGKMDASFFKAKKKPAPQGGGDQDMGF